MSRIKPALSDGRCFTSYLASCQYDGYMKDKYRVGGSDAQYRAFLQGNALVAQQETRKLSVTECAYPFLATPAPTATPSPQPVPVTAMARGTATPRALQRYA